MYNLEAQVLHRISPALSESAGEPQEFKTSRKGRKRAIMNERTSVTIFIAVAAVASLARSFLEFYSSQLPRSSDSH